MELNLKKEEDIYLNYSECPCCHEPFNTRSKRKTIHHAIPKFMNSKSEITMILCLDCHTRLNSFYNSQINHLNDQVTSSNWEEFKTNYTQLRQNFHNKKINRGQFGEGLWSNLISYLEATKNE